MGSLNKKSFSITIPLFLVLISSFAGCICLAPDPILNPVPDYGRPGLTPSQMRSIANRAVIDDVIYRHGIESQPNTSSISLRPYNEDEAIIFGRVSYYPGRTRVYRNFECLVNRFSGDVRGLRYY